MKKWQWALFLSCALYVISVNFSLLPAQETSDPPLALTEEETEESRQRLKRRRDCERYIEVSRRADFTEEELKKNIIIQFGDESINCWDFVKAEEERMNQARKAQEEEAKKRYITVKDITEDLIKKESDQVSNLRDNLIFTGDQEE